MNKYFTALLALVLLTGLVSAQPSQGDRAAFNLFSAVENFVENAEVQLAGIIGGSDLKAKALANNAEENLAEAEKLTNQNKSGLAAQKIEKYGINMNKSQKILDKGQNKELKDQIQNLSNQKIQRLEEVKKKVPKQAQKGINNAINNSKKRGQPPTKEKTRGNNTEKPEKPLENTSGNQTKKPREKIDKNIPEPENKTGKNQTEFKPDEKENTTNKRQNLSEETEETSNEIRNSSNSNDTDTSVGKPVEDNTSKPSLNR